MASRVLAGLVTEALHERSKATLSSEEQARFYQDFEKNVSQPVEEIRASKRRAYEETQELAIW